jgi:hypothetical protein
VTLRGNRSDPGSDFSFSWRSFEAPPELFDSYRNGFEAALISPTLLELPSQLQPGEKLAESRHRRKELADQVRGGAGQTGNFGNRSGGTCHAGSAGVPKAPRTPAGAKKSFQVLD